MRTPKYLVRTRSWSQPTRVFNRGGWRTTNKWTPWRTISKHDTYLEAAAEANHDRHLKGLTRAAVFYRGKPYRECRNYLGEVVYVKVGDDALLNARGNW